MRRIAVGWLMLRPTYNAELSTLRVGKYHRDKPDGSGHPQVSEPWHLTRKALYFKIYIIHEDI